MVGEHRAGGALRCSGAVDRYGAITPAPRLFLFTNCLPVHSRIVLLLLTYPVFVGPSGEDFVHYHACDYCSD